MIMAECISSFTTSYGLPVSLFLAGLMGGFTHCVGMCSPFVLAQTGQNMDVNRIRGKLLIPYHLGRMFTYVGLAIAFSALFNLAFLFSDLRNIFIAPLLLLAGILFLASAFPALGQIFPWIIKFQSAQPFGFMAKYVHNFMKSDHSHSRFLLGVLLGFMPCGLVVAAIMAAATAASPIYAGLAMAAFALGTMPALMLVGIGSNALISHYPKLSKKLSQGAMTLSAFWLFALAGMLVF